MDTDGTQQLHWRDLSADVRGALAGLFANHKDTTGGFYERERASSVLHFLCVDKPDQPRAWAVHFDLYSPVHSLASMLNHIRHEALGGVTPDWRAIKTALSDTA